MEFNQDTLTIVFAALFALSELIGLIPSVKSSSVFQAIYNGLKTLAKKDEK